MKKITFLKQSIIAFLLLFTLNTSAQSDYFDVLVGASTSGLGRAPQGSQAVTRAVFLVTATEMADAGFTTGDQINALSFFYSVAQNIPTTGNMVVYLENTADVANNKSTTWATALTGMTTVSNSAATIPNVAGPFFVPFSGGSNFTYSGVGLYVGFDYQNLTNPVATTGNVAFCNNLLAAGLKSAMSAPGTTTPPTTIAPSAFRPIIKLGIPSACSMPVAPTYKQSLSTLNSATVSWNAPDGGSSFDVEYGPYNYVQGTGTTVSATSNVLVISGLLESSVYDFYVRKNCGSGVYSDWSKSSFATSFAASTPSYSTSFEQENLNFIGWANPSATLVAGDWAIGNYGAGTLVQDGVSSVVSITPTTVAANNFMFSRGLNLTAGATVTVSFYLSNFRAAGVTTSGALQVTYGTAQTVASQTNIINTQTGITAAPFTLKTYTFVPATTGVYFIGFKNNSPASAGTHALIVDNFTVSQVLSTQSFLNDAIKVYPNPVNSVLSIDTNNSFDIEKISVSDVNGRVVKSQMGGSLEVNLSDLNTGIYFVNIQTNQGSVIKKITKN